MVMVVMMMVMVMMVMVHGFFSAGKTSKADGGKAKDKKGFHKFVSGLRW